MSLYLIIGCVLLLVIAVFLKIRGNAENDQKGSSSRSTSKKPINKSTAREARSTQAHSASVTTDQDTAPISQPITQALRKSLEKLILEKNFTGAEATINQALNQNQHQHELYLFLLDVHLAQKDDFAAKQLISHIKSLGLTELSEKAEAKLANAVNEEIDQQDSLQFNSSTTQASAVATPNNTSAFDELVNIPTTQKAPQALQFDQIQEELTTPLASDSQPTANQPTPVADHQPLEFTFEKPVATEQNLNDVSKSLEFEKSPLDFTLESAKVQDSTKVSNLASDQSLDTAPEFKLDFVESTPKTEKPSVDFKFDAPVDSKPATNFETSKTEVPTSSDPLVQSFQELADVDEIQLNLALAQQYITLGAYEAAKAILSQNTEQYSAEQREKSQTLLNQIAS